MPIPLRILLQDLQKLTGKKIPRSFKFGQSENLNLVEKNIDLIATKVDKDPKKESKIKRALYNTLTRAGVKLGDYLDYTLKELLKITVKYIGPLVIISLLVRYREPIYKKLVSKEDQERLKQVNLKKNK